MRTSISLSVGSSSLSSVSPVLQGSSHPHHDDNYGNDDGDDDDDDDDGDGSDDGSDDSLKKF